MGYKLKKDKYVNTRDGNSHFIEICCSKCSERVVLYQKDGIGSLYRLYLDRIFEPETLSVLQYRCLDKKGLPRLMCAKCNVLIGVPMIYVPEKRLAFRLIHGTFLKKKSTVAID